MSKTPTLAALTIRYADPVTTPGRYTPVNHFGDMLEREDDYWTVSGEFDLLQVHVDRALADDNLNDYLLTRRAAETGASR